LPEEALLRVTRQVPCAPLRQSASHEQFAASQLSSAVSAYQQAHPSDHRVDYLDISDLYQQPRTIHPMQAQEPVIASDLGPRIQAAIRAQAPEPCSLALLVSLLSPLPLLSLRPLAAITDRIFARRWHKARRTERV
jgi:hypothetical protein